MVCFSLDLQYSGLILLSRPLSLYLWAFAFEATVLYYYQYYNCPLGPNVAHSKVVQLPSTVSAIERVPIVSALCCY